MDNNLHNIDLLMLGNKGKKYNNINNINNLNENDYENINNLEIMFNDFYKYKKEIKSKINKLYIQYLDNSNNKVNFEINNKINGYFYFFIKSLIEDIKNENIKTAIQDELLNYNNKNINNKNIKNVNNNNKNNNNEKYDISYQEMLINNMSKNKSKNMEQYLDIKKINNIKILPKKRH